MLISLLIGYLSVLGVGISGTYGYWLKIYNQEKSQIALDNSGILIGKTQRQIWSELERVNQQIRVLEKLHHPLHLVANIPILGIESIAADEAMELEIEGLMTASEVLARAHWSNGVQRAYGEIRRLKAQDVELDSQVTLPLYRNRCGVCGLETEWDLSKMAEPVAVHAKVANVESVKVTPVRGSGGWNYRMESFHEAGLF